ncbi:hypothetical protein FOL47_010180 [Perkinsus chesapeaki]|uniref:Uncharacterized protein n=1 Tax=Perkinsus chesapeaki TaxID=330153 RepID=A0A7J6L436_PERCH|nr:hypothetical protein FOL47_010180 [Perkinsus chesapeaki]
MGSDQSTLEPLAPVASLLAGISCKKLRAIFAEFEEVRGRCSACFSDEDFAVFFGTSAPAAFQLFQKTGKADFYEIHAALSLLSSTASLKSKVESAVVVGDFRGDGRYSFEDACFTIECCLDGLARATGKREFTMKLMNQISTELSMELFHFYDLDHRDQTDLITHSQFVRFLLYDGIVRKYLARTGDIHEQPPVIGESAAEDLPVRDKAYKFLEHFADICDAKTVSEIGMHMSTMR